MDTRTIDTYDAHHTQYDNHTALFWSEFPASIFDEFSEACLGTTVLNIGSGPGRDSLLLKERSLNVTCFDASQEMVARTQKLGFESHTGDMLQLPFEDNSFDGAWMYTSLIHVPRADAPQALTQAHRILRIGAPLFVGVIFGTEERYRESKHLPAARLFVDYTDDTLSKLLTDAGFNITSITHMPSGKWTYLHILATKQ